MYSSWHELAVPKPLTMKHVEQWMLSMRGEMYYEEYPIRLNSLPWLMMS
jgi:hypothetical protein